MEPLARFRVYSEQSKFNGSPIGLGFGPNDQRILIPWDKLSRANNQPTTFHPTYFLIDPISETPFQQIPVSALQDRPIIKAFAQQADRIPWTFDVSGEASFAIARSDARFQFATLEFRSWNTGEINRLYRVEDGRFSEGIFYDSIHWLYPLANRPAAALLNLETGVIEKYFEAFLKDDPSDPSRLVTNISMAPDRKLISWWETPIVPTHPLGPIFIGNRAKSVVAFHPTAPGDVEGLVFDDVNGNGQLDLSLIKSEFPHIVYVIDVSGSSSDPFQGSPVGDVNGDGMSDTILDAEIATFQEFHRSLIAFGKGDDTKSAVVAFASSAVAYGYDQITEDNRAMVWATADDNANQVPDVIDALGKVRLSNGNVGSGTDFRSGLAKAKAVFAASGTSVNQGNIIFLSDGGAGNNFATVVEDLRKLGVNMRAIGVGDSSSLSSLQVIDPTARKVTSTDELIEAFGPEEKLLSGVEVFADLNGNGLWEADEPSSTTRSDNPFTAVNEGGYYRINNLAPGPVSVRPKEDQFQLLLGSTVNIQPVVKTRHLLAVHFGLSAVAPKITLQPVSQSVAAGQPASFFVLATGEEPLSYQWRKDGNEIGGANSQFYVIAATTASDSGVYSVAVQNPGGSILSQDAGLEVKSSSSSFSIDSSAFEVVNVGGGQFLALTVNGTPGRTYQAYVKNSLSAPEWTKSGSPQVAGNGPLTLFVTAPGAASVFVIVAEIP